MENVTLDDITGLEDWSRLLSDAVASIGSAELSDALDWDAVEALSVETHLDRLDAAQAALDGIDWTAAADGLEPRLTRIGVSDDAIADVAALFEDFAAGDFSVLLSALGTIRSALADVPDGTLLAQAVSDAAGDDGTGDDGTGDDGTGDDIVRPAATGGDDVLVGTAGRDEVDLGGGDDAFWAGPDDAGGDILDGGAGDDALAGGAGNDFLLGSEGGDTLFGGDGDDFLDGGSEADTLWAGSGDDIVNGGEGDDQVFSGEGDDALFGADGDDRLFNGAGSDSVQGGAGNDRLWGGEGDDVLTGGEGADEFAFAEGNGADAVTDFADGEDRLRIEADGVSGLADLTLADTAEGATVSFGDTRITLEGATAADLGEDDFIFG